MQKLRIFKNLFYFPRHHSGGSGGRKHTSKSKYITKVIVDLPHLHSFGGCLDAKQRKCRPESVPYAARCLFAIRNGDIIISRLSSQGAFYAFMRNTASADLAAGVTGFSD